MLAQHGIMSELSYLWAQQGSSCGELVLLTCGNSRELEQLQGQSSRYSAESGPWLSLVECVVRATRTQDLDPQMCLLP